MKIGNLSLFNNHIASWHWAWSITWRWVLYAHKWNGEKLGFFGMRTHGGEGIHCGLNTKFFCVVYQSQPNCLRPTKEGRSQ